ncbi:MAG: NAD(P)-dependent oxidoreductase [Burkholderiales bacterium]|nr:NAD(P)-dependent oxidoreductase [Burkholderiales bacterium]
MNRPVLAYLGLGLMGLPMTQRLLAAGYTVHVWNRSPDKLAPALAAGALPAATPRAAAAAADIILMCLFDADAVEAVVFGVDGIAAAPGQGKVLVDHASIRPDRTRDFCARLKAANGMDWIDAPVSGGVKGAAEGTLAIMCGGDAAAFERVRPVLGAYAANVNRMGDSGAGQVTKLCNQVIVGSTLAVIAEAVRLAQNAGVDAAQLPRALAGGFADSRPLQIFVPRMIDRPAQSIGSANTMLKDLDTAVDLARATGTPLPVAGLANQLLRTLDAQGKGEEELSAIFDLYTPR